LVQLSCVTNGVALAAFETTDFGQDLYRRLRLQGWMGDCVARTQARHMEFGLRARPCVPYQRYDAPDPVSRLGCTRWKMASDEARQGCAIVPLLSEAMHCPNAVTKKGRSMSSDRPRRGKPGSVRPLILPSVVLGFINCFVARLQCMHNVFGRDIYYLLQLASSSQATQRTVTSYFEHTYRIRGLVRIKLEPSRD
jgi:hypothetical protein